MRRCFGVVSQPCFFVVITEECVSRSFFVCWLDMAVSASVFPACAGVNPPPRHPQPTRARVPRMCGGEPPRWSECKRTAVCSPNVRGGGVNPSLSSPVMAVTCIPHMCGGEPLVSAGSADTATCSPHERGCFVQFMCDYTTTVVFLA